MALSVQSSFGLLTTKYNYWKLLPLQVISI